MPYPHNLRSPVNVNAPRETGICDRCGFYYYLDDLPWQYDVRGNALANLGIRVCSRTCYDQPANILRPVIIVGPEGVVRNPRPTYYQQQAQGGSAAPGDVGDFLFPDATEIPP